MDTRNKLTEAKYFLDALIATQDKQEVFYFSLSAFLSSWKSVPDVMLYDFLDHFSLGLTREDKMYPHDFFIVAKSQDNKPALEFFKWWDKKRDELSKNPLWNMRHVVLHRGYPKEIKHTVYNSGSISSTSVAISISQVPGSGAVSPSVYSVDLPETSLEVKVPEVMDMCKDGFSKMVKIVEEAEKLFGIHL
jgi:hypothetical protein